MKLGKKYRVVQGTVMLSVTTQGTILVKRFSQDDILEYEKELVEPGMYVVTPVFTQLLPETAKQIRALYNRLRDNLKNAQFRILEDDTAEKPYYMQLFAKQDHMMLKLEVIVRANPKLLSLVDIDEIEEIAQELSTIDLESIVYYHDAELHNGLILPLDKSFIHDARTILRLRDGQQEA